jgi:hypothetical protein
MRALCDIEHDIKQLTARPPWWEGGQYKFNEKVKGLLLELAEHNIACQNRLSKLERYKYESETSNSHS